MSNPEKPWLFPKSTNGAGKGDGWGGPRKGASTSRIRPGDPDGIQAMRNDAEKIAEAVRRCEILRGHLYHLALNAQREETQLAATNSALDRLEGKALQRSDVTSGGDRLGYVIAAPEEDESAEEWEARQRRYRQIEQ